MVVGAEGYLSRACVRANAPSAGGSFSIRGSPAASRSGDHGFESATIPSTSNASIAASS